MWIPILIVVLIVGGIGVRSYTKKNDTPAEQIIEAVLKQNGVDIDFSAESKEEPKKE